MVITPFLAMTAAEMRNISDFPPKLAWMACHFSPYGPGLSNVPERLSSQAMIILDDSTPFREHDSGIIIRQLWELVKNNDCSGVLLDFQRPGNPEAAALALCLSQELPCPVIVSEFYAKDLLCPVCLPPVPLFTEPDQYLVPWKGRDIWLEISPEGMHLTLSEQGCEAAPLPSPDRNRKGFADKTLRCHYTIETNEKSAGFTLWRNADDLEQLLEDTHRLGVTEFIGLYQEFSQL